MTVLQWSIFNLYWAERETGTHWERGVELWSRWCSRAVMNVPTIKLTEAGQTADPAQSFNIWIAPCRWWWNTFNLINWELAALRSWSLPSSTFHCHARAAPNLFLCVFLTPNGQLCSRGSDASKVVHTLIICSLISWSSLNSPYRLKQREQLVTSRRNQNSRPAKQR